MAKFFIDRPVFAWVIAIMIMMAGALSITTLPVSQYPTIAPPSVSISGSYPGASAQTVEESVTQIIEQNMTGLDNLLYMNSTSDATGRFSVSLTFASDVDPDIAQVQVQNKLATATPLLPQEVKNQGVRVTKSSSGFLMVVGFISTDNSMTNSDIADYANSNIKDPLSRVEGVGGVRVFGAQKAMRIWLDPHKLTAYNLTPNDVTSAIQAQNKNVAVGSLSAAPTVSGEKVTATINVRGRLTSVSEFEDILLRVNTDGSRVRIKDVARVEIGSESYRSSAKYNGMTSTGVAIELASGGNAMETSKAVREAVSNMEPFFPQGLEVVYPFDTTPFIEISIKEVVKTLIEAIILVFLVMLVFLQNIRATLIPTIAVPVVLLGTFGVMAAFGYSINTLTMFGLVLAIGLLVDDAIVVVENVERVMDEEGLSAREATRESMGQITGALLGMTLVLSAVFVPMAFFGGSVGEIYRQFSITIVSAMVLSLIVALTLTPALCATILRSKDAHHKTTGLSGLFNKVFDRGTQKYKSGVSKAVHRIFRYFAIYIAIIVGLGFLWQKLPTSFLPEEDQAVFMVMTQLPEGSTKERTDEVMSRISDHILEQESDLVESVFAITGFSFAGSGENMGMAFVKLKHWDDRPNDSQSVNAIIGRLMGGLSQIKEANVYAFNVPAIRGLGNSSGFSAYLVDKSGVGHEALVNARNQLLGMAAQHPDLSGVRPNGMEDNPQFNINVDYEKAMAQGLSSDAVDSALAIAWGSSYVNDFLNNGRVKKVYVQADAPYRMGAEDLSLWHIRNKDGDMVPFDTIATTEWSFGSPRLERYNGFPSLNIQGSAAPGKSSGDAMIAIEEIVAQLPDGIGLEWTGASYQERQNDSQTFLLYGISMLVVFLALAALYESWSVPFAVMMVVPLGVLGSVLAATFNGLPNDVYFQVGLLTTIGLSAKNAILIVEFAKHQYEKGKSLIDATIEACRMRLRPILMTSFAFMLGVLPLALSSGAGAASRNAIGWAVFGGMAGATILGILFVPVFYVLVMSLFGKKRQHGATPTSETA